MSGEMNKSVYSFLQGMDLEEAFREANLVKWQDKRFAIMEFNVEYGRRARLSLELQEVILTKEAWESEEKKMSSDQECSNTLEELQRELKNKYGHLEKISTRHLEHSDSIRFLCTKIDALETAFREFGEFGEDIKKLTGLMEKHSK